MSSGPISEKAGPMTSCRQPSTVSSRANHMRHIVMQGSASPAACSPVPCDTNDPFEFHINGVNYVEINLLVESGPLFLLLGSAYHRTGFVSREGHYLLTYLGRYLGFHIQQTSSAWSCFRSRPVHNGIPLAFCLHSADNLLEHFAAGPLLHPSRAQCPLLLTQPPASLHHQPRSLPPSLRESSHLPPCIAPTSRDPPLPVC